MVSTVNSEMADIANVNIGRFIVKLYWKGMGNSIKSRKPFQKNGSKLMSITLTLSKMRAYIRMKNILTQILQENFLRRNNKPHGIIELNHNQYVIFNHIMSKRLFYVIL